MALELKWDERKRAVTLAERGLDFADCLEVFSGRIIELADDRADYGERRTLTYGLLDRRMAVVVSTIRDGYSRIISMRKADDREQARFGPIPE